jgi:hypothetical protein
MGSSLNYLNSTVKALTYEMIYDANQIVLNCTGTNCNTSVQTQDEIFQELEELAQTRSSQVTSALGISETAPQRAEIDQAFINLGAAVAGAYNYQCGNLVPGSFACVDSSTAVIATADHLNELLAAPTKNRTNNLIILGTLSGLTALIIILFIVFLIILLFNMLVITETPVVTSYLTTAMTPRPTYVPQYVPQYVSTSVISPSDTGILMSNLPAVQTVTAVPVPVSPI